MGHSSVGALLAQGSGAPGILDELLKYYVKQPEVLLFTSVVTALTAGGFLIVVVRAISKAGKVQPPRVVLSLLLALVGLVAILGVIARPEVEALAVAAGTAVGALGGALATAYTPGAIRAADEEQRQVPGEEVDGGGDNPDT